MRKHQTFFIGALVGMAAATAFFDYYGCLGQTITERDTITVCDTVRPAPVAVHDTVTRYITKKAVPLHDTLFIYEHPENIYALGDSVVVPVTQRVYTDDSTYRAWVSGYEARLDSIEIYRHTTFIHSSPAPPPRLTIGVGCGVGYGFGIRKADVFVGLTASYRLYGK